MTNINQCYKCKELKDSTEFFKNKRKSNGLHSYCKACNKEATRIASKKYRQDPTKEQNSKLKHRYGVTLNDKDQMIVQQNGCCAICNIELSTAKAVHLDHCHTSGDVRGVLCQPCNIGLGGFKDSIETLENAIEYLKRHKGEIMGNQHMFYQLSVNY